MLRIRHVLPKENWSKAQMYAYSVKESVCEGEKSARKVEKRMQKVESEYARGEEKKQTGGKRPN